MLLSGGGRGAQKATSADSAVGHGLHSPRLNSIQMRPPTHGAQSQHLAAQFGMSFTGVKASLCN